MRWTRIGGVTLLTAGAALILAFVAYRTPFTASNYAWYAGAVVGSGLLLALAYLAYWSTTVGGIAGLTIDADGLDFLSPRGSTRRLRWSDPDFVAEVWDTTALPPTDEFVAMVAPYGFGFSTGKMKGILVQTPIPREAYHAILEGARSHGLVATPSESGRTRKFPSVVLRAPGLAGV